MYFSAKNRINILLSAVPIRAWRLAYKERIGIDDRGHRPLRKIHLLAYVRQDANVATGECRRQADVRRYCFFDVSSAEQIQVMYEGRCTMYKISDSQRCESLFSSTFGGKAKKNQDLSETKTLLRGALIKKKIQRCVNFSALVFGTFQRVWRHIRIQLFVRE